MAKGNASLRIISLQSGSSGNSVFVEAAGTRLLLDAGISGKAAEARLSAAGYAIRDVDALVLSHDHGDHANFAGVYHRNFGLPIHATAATWEATARRHKQGKVAELQAFEAGKPLRIGSLTVETYRTPHDAVEGVVFVVDDGERRLGFLTDLGDVFPALVPLLATLDAVILESNYDPMMLDNGPYRPYLKRRIKGPRGHISNIQSAALVRSVLGRMRWVCLAHLSEVNNTPELALAAHRQAYGDVIPIHVASRYEASETFLL